MLCGPYGTPAPNERCFARLEPHLEPHMETILIVVLLVLLLGGGGWYGHGRMVQQRPSIS